MVSRISEQQGFTCDVLFDDSNLVVASLAGGAEPGSGSALAGYWVVFERPVDLVEVISAVRRAWWMRGVGSFEVTERSECELALCDLFGVDDVNKVANVAMILATHVGKRDDLVAEIVVVGSAWKRRGRRERIDAGRGILPFDADDALIAEALEVAIAVSTAGPANG